MGQGLGKVKTYIVYHSETRFRVRADSIVVENGSVYRFTSKGGERGESVTVAYFPVDGTIIVDQEAEVK